MRNSFDKIKCLLCSSSRKHQLYLINGYKLIQCSNCNFIYTIPIPSRSQIKKLYKNFKFEDGFANEKSARKDATRILRNLEALGYSGGKILDIGSGTGFFLDEARKSGWDTLGVDLAKAPSEYARTKLKLKIVNKDILEFKPKTRFNVVILSQVIEHAANPYPILSKVKTLLEDDGISCLSTPNITSLMAKVMGAKFNYLIPPYHLLYFSPKTFTTLLEKASFEVVRAISYGYPEDVGIIYRRLREKFKTNNSKISFKTKYLASSKLERYNFSVFNNLKHDFFENVIRNFAYPILDIGKSGSMLEFYVVKNKL